MSKKLALTTLIGLMMITCVAAQGATPDQAPDNPGNQTIQIPDLPGQASDTASKVIGNVNNFLMGSIDNLGKTLSQILGGGTQ